MAIDRGKLPRVAWGLALIVLEACGPRVRPDMPVPDEPVARRERAAMPHTGGRQVIVGELCPRGAAGRPAVAPLLMHTTRWSDTPIEVASAVERGRVPRFVAFGVDGKPAGLFDTLGLAEIGAGQAVAAGTYVGGAPCSSDAGSGQRAEDLTCASATNGCGLAVAEIAQPDDPPETSAYQVGGACVVADALVVDIDGDGAVESFPLAGVLDGIRGPAQEWSAHPSANGTCAPRFALYGVRLAPEAEPGKPPNDEAVVMLDLLGVADLDEDGRKELVIALRFPTVRTIAVFSATGSSQRLELAGEARSFRT